MSITPPRPQHGEPVHSAKIHADYLGRPIAAGDWVSIDEAAPVLVLDLYREGQFVYGAPDGQLLTYFCCCVKKVCPSPAHQRPGDSLAAPAEAGQGVCTLCDGEVGPAVANSLHELQHVVRDSLIAQCLRFVAETGDREFPVLLRDALQLQADEAAHSLCLIDGHQASLTKFERELAQGLIVGCRAGFIHAAKVIRGAA